MLQKITNSRITYAVLSIILAIGIWVYVVWIEDPSETVTLNNIPIVFEGTEGLTARGLVITSVSTKTVSVEMIGQKRVLATLDAESVYAIPYVSNITSPDEYEITYEVRGVPSSLTLTDRNPQYLVVKVERMVSRTIDVQTNITANAADGYQMGTVAVVPETIEIKGAENEVYQVSHALVNIDGDDLTKSIMAEYPFQLIGYQDGEVLNSLSVTPSVETVQVSVPIVVLKEVPLSVNLIYGGGAIEENVNCEIKPESIFVSGDENAVNSLQAIELGDIDIANISANRTLTFEIALDSQLENVSGVTQAEVTITFEGLSTRVIDVDNISWINEPEGFTVENITQSRKVLVRGTEEQLESIGEYQLRIVADLSDVPTAVGRYTMPVTVYLDSNTGAGVVSEYQIVISLEQSS